VINPFVPADGISDLLLKVETLARELRESMDRANARIHGLHRGPSIVE
jgi:hypothetical protein